MTEKDIIKMSLKELKRLKVIQEVIDKHFTQNTAASMLGLSERQIRRLISAVRKEGEKGIIHKSRGKLSNRRIPDKIKTEVLELYRGKYLGFGPTLASEKLLEIDNIDVSDEILRKWLIAEGVWKRKRKNRGHRKWRERKECFGQMVQLDGSHHDWLEGRGPKLVIMGYIDDATNETFARFYDYEGTFPAMDSFKRYVSKYGIPHSIYLDKHSTYKSTKRLTPEEELKGLVYPQSQFERALSELGVNVIHANSPQAKGRIERLFGTLQDRLVKEMRLKNISTKEEANKFLENYLPIYNKKFRVIATKNSDVHMEPPKYLNLDSVLSIQTKRTVRNDNTVAHNGKLYQIEEKTGSRKIIVEERLDGSFHITNNGNSLKFKEITERPKRTTNMSKEVSKPRKPYIPPKDHPWRLRRNKSREQRQVVNS